MFLLDLESKGSFYTSMFMKHRLALFSTAFLIAFSVGAIPQTVAPDTAVTVPFIGCQSDGQTGLVDPPEGKNKTLHMPAQAAQRLAYYKSDQGIGVLAPRGWHCFGTYGSSGSTLYVSPTPIDATTLFSTNWQGFTGPVVQISDEIGDTSGRFAVARMIARVFPSHKAFVRRVIAEGFAQTSDFPSGPYPKDNLVYKTKDLVEYLTPAQTDGLGTQSRLQKNDDRIRGVAILGGPDTDLIFLATRLPSDVSDLASLIIKQVESDATQLEH